MKNVQPLWNADPMIRHLLAAFRDTFSNRGSIHHLHRHHPVLNLHVPFPQALSGNLHHAPLSQIANGHAVNNGLQVQPQRSPRPPPPTPALPPHPPRPPPQARSRDAHPGRLIREKRVPRTQKRRESSAYCTLPRFSSGQIEQC